MLFLPALTILSSILGSQALPNNLGRSTADAGVKTRQTNEGIVTMCTGVNNTGTCTNMTVALGYDVCTTLEGTEWLYAISTFEPEAGVVCWLNNSTNCGDICMSPEGCNMIVEYPACADLTLYGSPAWTNRVGSFSCEVDSSTKARRRE